MLVKVLAVLEGPEDGSVTLQFSGGLPAWTELGPRLRTEPSFPGELMNVSEVSAYKIF